MFSVYGVAGQLFRGSLEQLRQIGGISAIARTHTVQAIGRDGWEASASSPLQSSASSNSRVTDESHRTALAAYAQSQKIEQPRHPLKLVRDLMSHKTITLHDTATVMEAWQTLVQQGVGQAPVLNAEERLVGLLCRSDLLHPDRLPALDSHPLVWQALLAQHVSSVMWSPVPSVAPDTDIRRVAGVLLDTGLPGLPVVDEPGLVIGFVARSDILRAVVTDPPLDLWG